MFNLNPKEDKFYVMMLDAAKNVNEAAIILRESMNFSHNEEIDLNAEEEIKKKGDEIVKNVIKELNEAFITPIDREDIYEIVKVMNYTIELINSAIHRFVMFNIKESTESLKSTGDMLVEATKEIVNLTKELKMKDKPNHINEKIQQIAEIEEKGDLIFRETVAKLFREESNPLTVMKWKEIYQIMEDAIDNCNSVANIIEGVTIKNA